MYGLPPHTIQAIQGVFAAYPQLEQAILYGSRARGNYRNGSDIDLTLLGSALNLSHLHAIETKLDDLLLPYYIDLSLHQHIQNPELLAHIEAVGVVFWGRGDSSDLRSLD